MKKEVNLSVLFVLLVSLVSSNSLRSGTQCHPQCSWKCDDPHCPAICDPVCEPPKCHTSCAEPKNAICDVKCEKPECEIKCPDKGCEMFDCPKCVTVCKAPHCVTHCQAPKPECEAVCEEPKCDWKCHKPNCPKPKCELVCENPNCTPKVECCNCGSGSGQVASPFPFFKETEKNPTCCGCSKPLRLISADNANTQNSRKIHDYGTHVVQYDSTTITRPFQNPKQIGDAFYETPTKVFGAFDKTSNQ